MKTRFLVFGVLLGGAVGIIGSSVQILVWISKGRPEILIRRGWEVLHIISMVMFGAGAGCLYGIILSWIISPESLRRRGVFIFLSTLLAGVVLYTLGAFASMRTNDISPSIWANLVVFVTSLGIARLLSRPSRMG